MSLHIKVPFMFTFIHGYGLDPSSYAEGWGATLFVVWHEGIYLGWAPKNARYFQWAYIFCPPSPFFLSA